jgi:hypothetical protein
VPLLHRVATDIAGQCGHRLLKARRLAWGWTVADFAGRAEQVEDVTRLIATAAEYGTALPIVTLSGQAG